MKVPKRLLKIIIIIAAISCSIVLIPWELLRVWLSPLPTTIQDQLNFTINYNLDGIIVYVDQINKPPAVYAAGWMDKEKKVPADPNSLFKIGSISKLYIAAATAKLINKKSLALDNTITQLLPEYAERIENASQITLRMLLEHRSGIPDWIEDPGFPWDKPPKKTKEVLELVLDDPAEFEPNSRYDYSNTNYLLIGNILDKTLGYDHQLYIDCEILIPLGLTHTFGSLKEVDPKTLCSGYDAHYDEDVKLLDFVSPGGSMIATAQDVGMFLRALNDGSLLNKEEQIIYSSFYKYEHTGLLPGYQSIARYHKDIDAVVIQFVNTSGGNMWTISEMVYDRIIKILKNKTD